MKKFKFLLLLLILLGNKFLLGQNWILRHNFDLNSITCIQFNDTAKGYILGFETDISGLALTTSKYTIDGGITWKQSELPFVDYIPINNQHIGQLDYFVGIGNNFDGVIGKSRNNGKSWQMTTLNFQILNLIFSDTSNGVVVGKYGNIYTTKDGGKNWNFVTKALGDIYGIDKLERDGHCLLHICGTNGLIGSSIDSGKTWDFKYYPSMNNLKSIIFDKNGTEWVCNDVGQLFRSIDTGKTWILNFSNSFEDFAHFGRDNQNRIWLCGDYGRLVLNQDTSWYSYSSFPGNHDFTFDYITDFVFLPNNLGWFCTNEGNLFSNSNIDSNINTSIKFNLVDNQLLAFFSNGSVHIKNTSKENIPFTIYSSDGRLIYSANTKPETIYSINAYENSITSGTYFIVLKIGNNISIKKLVVNN